MRNLKNYNVNLKDSQEDTFKELLKEPDHFDQYNFMISVYEKQIEAGIQPDTLGADYFFAEGFITEDMSYDSEAIQQDFMKHCHDKLEQLSAVEWFDNDSLKDCELSQAMFKKVVNLIINGANIGDAYCTELLKVLYKLYYKKEYNQLKRFSRITDSEIMSLSLVGEATKDHSVHAMGRILGMSRVMGIEQSRECAFLYLILERVMNDFQRDNEQAIIDREMDQEIFDDSLRVVDEWYKTVSRDRDGLPILKQFTHDQKFVELCLGFHDYPCDFVINSLQNNMGLKMQFARTLAVLRMAFPNREFTFEDVQHYCQIYSLVAAIVDISDQYDDDTGFLLGRESPYAGDEEQPLFKPEMVVLQKQTKPVRKEASLQKKPESLSKDDKAVFQAEIDELRKRLNESEQQNRYLRKLYHEEKTANSEKEDLLKKYEDDRQELISLREFAYNSTQEYPDISEEEYETMKAAVSRKKLMIIGGHTNWINKLRKEFPGWIFVPAEISKVADGKQFENIDKLYFFTDHLSHGTYGKYIAIIREKNIPFGYLKNVNLETMIRQIYEEI